MTNLEDLTDNEIAVTIDHHESELARLEAEVARRRSEQEAGSGYNDLVNWEDWRLKESTAYHRREIEDARKRLQYFESGLLGIEAELNRRQLVANESEKPAN